MRKPQGRWVGSAVTVLVFVGVGAVVAAIFTNWALIPFFFAFGLMVSIPNPDGTREEWEAKRDESDAKVPPRLW